ncbi:MAG: ABC transporter substrate-binding protein, partial [Promethearchaeota archaeon]
MFFMRKKPKGSLLIIVILTIMMVSPIMTGHITSESHQSNQPQSNNILTGMTLNYGVGSLIMDLDPQFAWDSASVDVINQVCEGLFGYDLNNPELSIVPVLATELGTWNAEATEYTVTLKQGVTFHDGSVFDAWDVQWTFNRLNWFIDNDMTQIAELYEPLASLYPGNPLLINNTEILDNYTVRFHLNYPYVPFMSLLCFSGSAILSQMSTPEFALLETATDILVGTGPYEYIEQTLEYTKLRAYDDYHSKWINDSPEEVNFIFYPDKASKSQALLDGEVHMIDNMDPSYIDLFESNPYITVTEPDKSTIIYYMGMNNKQINRTMRQAINYAIDYEFLIEDLLGGTVDRVTSPIPEGILYHNPDLDNPTLNVFHARQILVDDGVVPFDTNVFDDSWWRNKADFDPIATYNYTWNIGNMFRENLGILTVDNLREIGIDVVLTGLLWEDYLPLLLGDFNKLQLFGSGWGPDYNDPSNFINPLFSNTSASNNAQVNDPTLQAMMMDGLTEINETARRDLYYDMQTYIVEDLMPWVFLYTPLQQIAHSKLIGIISLNSMGILHFYDIDIPFDRDNDGLTDREEIDTFYTDPLNPDTDNDRLTDGEEVNIYHTNPLNPDSDNDGVFDGEEIYYHADPLNADSDNDGLSDGDEINLYSTDPIKPDSDYDGLSDGEEINLYSTDPIKMDSDNDGLTDGEEINLYYSDPIDPDSDNDGVSDGEEIYYHADPLNADS